MSYGHDEHISLAMRIRDDLRARGHIVWFDEERLLAGHDWEISIEKGIDNLIADKSNSAFILLLTPHAVRRPDGYCLNEISWALSRGLTIIPVMVVDCEPPLSICRIQWLDMRNCTPIQDKEAMYKIKFEKLLLATEENQGYFEGQQQLLINKLQPLQFDADILFHSSKFIGRQWVFESLNQWLADGNALQKVFWITGGPGVGKTALAVEISNRYAEVAAFHFCKFGHAQKSDPLCVVTSVAYQLSTQLPEYMELLVKMDIDKALKEDAETIFSNIIVEPISKISKPGRQIIILIDALDEATAKGKNSLASFIAKEFLKTPPWLRLIITSRLENEVTAPLQGLNPFMLDAETENNLADIRAYLMHELGILIEGHPKSDQVLTEILKKSEGVFLYAERVCSDLLNGHLSLDRLDEFPQGLGGMFWQYFDRQFTDLDNFRKVIRPALRVILCVSEPLPLEILQSLFKWYDEDLSDFTRSLGSLFPVSSVNDICVIKPFHKSLADWLTNEIKAGPYFVSSREGHRLLADFCSANWQIDFNEYAITKVIFHLNEAKKYEEAVALVLDPVYQEKIIAKPGFNHLLANFFIAEQGAKGKCGLAGAACLYIFLSKQSWWEPGAIENLKIRECVLSVSNQKLLTDISSESAKWLREEYAAKGCAKFIIQVLNAFKPASYATGVKALSEFVLGNKEPNSLDDERKSLLPIIEEAKSVPRERQKPLINLNVQHTAHYHPEILENELLMVDAALCIEPVKVLKYLCYSQHFKTLCDEDESFYFEIGNALEENSQYLNNKLAMLFSSVSGVSFS